MKSIKITTSFNLILFILINILLNNVNGHCTNRNRNEQQTSDNDADDGTSSNIKSKITNFFENVGCKLHDGAAIIKDSAKSGYDYVKEKVTSLTTTKTKPSTIATATTSTPNSDEIDAIDGFVVKPEENIDVRITFVDNDSDLVNTTKNTTTIDSFSVDSRALFNAPDSCPEGQKKDAKGYCRIVF